jgi:hypothetical protein
MGALLTKLITNLAIFLPSIIEAKKIIVDKDTRKDNAAAVSTTIAKAGTGATAVLALSPDMPPELAVATAVLSLLAYFYRRQQGPALPG